MVTFNNIFIKMKKISYILLILAVVCFASCADDYQPEPRGKNDGTAPAPITHVSVKNIHGGAIIKYAPSDDVDLLCVKAVFTNSQGIQQEVKSSMYVDSLVIEGLGDTQKREIKLYSVDRHENKSEPVSVTIEPLAPAVVQVMSSLDVVESFGGFFLNFTNTTRSALSFYVYKWVDETNEYEIHDVFSSKQEVGQLTIKGLEHKLLKLAIFVRDKWENTSDTLYTEITPWKESILDKKKFQLAKVLDDISWDYNEGYHTRLWDDQIGGWNWGHTIYPVPFPHAFSVDLNVNVRLSQFQFWQRLDKVDLLYAHGAPKRFKVYGCEDGKDLQNPDNWIVLFDGEMQRPSGGLFGDPSTQEDIEEANRGHVFTMNQNVPFIRYFRFQSLMSWSGMETSVISEITLWGDIQGEE